MPDFSNLKLHDFSNVDYTRDNSKEIEPIKLLFKDHDLVLLAESTHYDGATIDAQCMIMKELIDAGTINTIYTESSWLNADTIMRILLKEGLPGKEKAHNFATSGEMINWRDNDFWDYLVQKIIERKVRIVGFDIETTDRRLARLLFNEVAPVFSKAYSTDKSKFDRIKKIFYKFEYLFDRMSFSQEEFNDVGHFIDHAKSYYHSQNNSHKEYQWHLIGDYFYWLYHRQFLIPEKDYYELYRNLYNISISNFNSVRDSIMAEIFIKDYTENTGVKAIIKTSSYHSLRNFRNNSPIEGKYIDKNVHVFNDILNKKLATKIYSIGFVAASGKWGLNYLGDQGKHAHKVKAPKGSFESYFKKSGKDYFFTDIQESFDIESDFIMKVVFQKAIKAKWAKIFSGIFFIKEMYQIKYLYPEKHVLETEILPLK